jgi:cell division protein FtsB
MQIFEIATIVLSFVSVIGLGSALALWVKLEDEREDYEKLQKEYKAYKDNNVSEREEIQYLKAGTEHDKALIESYRDEHDTMRDELKVKSRKIELLQEENDYLLEHGPNILKLPLKKEIFDEVMNGKRNMVTVTVKESTKKRYYDSEGGLKPFHAVEVFNGYTNRSENALFKIIGISGRDLEEVGTEKIIFDIGDRLN